MDQQPSLLRARGLVVHRGAARVLNNVSLDLLAGETAAVQGVSGGGKSTLLSTVCGLLEPEAGSVIVAGSQVSGRPDRVRSNIRLQSFGIVFQGDEFIPELTLRENISLPLRLSRNLRSIDDLQSALAPLEDRLGIAGLGDRLPWEVSGGQLQRAAVARAVVHKPSVVLADEPTGSLDEQSSRDAMRILLELAHEGGSAVLVVTHDDEVANMCQTKYLMADGALHKVSAGMVGESVG